MGEGRKMQDEGRMVYWLKEKKNKGGSLLRTEAIAASTGRARNDANNASMQEVVAPISKRRGHAADMPSTKLPNALSLPSHLNSLMSRINPLHLCAQGELLPQSLSIRFICTAKTPFSLSIKY